MWFNLTRRLSLPQREPLLEMFVLPSFQAYCSIGSVLPDYLNPYN